MKIAVDAMGGDDGARAAVEGAVRAIVEDGTSVCLVGRRESIERTIESIGSPVGKVEIVHAEQVVGMDEPATSALRRKQDSSIRVCAELVRDRRAQAFVTAGNTGAAMAAAVVVMGTLPGIDRPALAALFPNRKGRSVVLDVGANVDSKPRHLRQFAVMGHFYAQEVLATPEPRVGLLSVGEEKTKGTETTREVFEVLQETGLNFVGNVEGGDIFDGSVDVVVCDGFVGNVLLKGAESVAAMVGELVREELEHSLRTRIGALLARPALAAVERRVDSEEYGAVPLLGVDGGCFIAHGSTSASGIRNAVRGAVGFVGARVHDKIRDKVAIMHEQEQRLLGAGAP